MAIEIERKFLVATDDWRSGADAGHRMQQGYLCRPETSSVRVRVTGAEARLNIKSADAGMRRMEFEYAIPVDEAREMLECLSVGPVIDKTRYHVPAGNHVWEVDVFHGANDGLVVAEIELPSEDASFERPSWLGREVTDERRFYNVYLVDHPYRDWSADERR